MISIIIPTIRPNKIPALLEAIKVAVSYNHEIIWEEDTQRIGAPKMVKRLVDKTQYDWVVFLGDDTVPEPRSIDIAFEFAREKGAAVVGFNDGHGTKGTHWIAHKSILDHLENKELFYTGYIHNFCDDELRVKAEKLGLYAWCQDAKIQHIHPAFDVSVDKSSYEKQLNKENWSHDEALFLSRNAKISVVMIVKNEEAMLSNCLASVQDADEIIIVDTGSVDKTKQIAAQFTDKIYDFEWCDDFAKARNFALSKASNDWVLSIDADEVLQVNGINDLRKYLFTTNHAVGVKMVSGNNSYHVPRLFRNMNGVGWIGKIHEIINVRDYDKANVSITYGSSPAHAYDPERNIRILKKAHEENPDDTRVMYYLGREYGYYKKWDEAKLILEKYLTKSTWLPEKADAHFMLAVMYWFDGKGNGEKTRYHCLQAININANFKAAILLMAQASFEKNAKQWMTMAQNADNSDTLFARESFTTI